MTYRRLAVLLEHLPPESATKTAMRDAQGQVETARQSAAPGQGYGPWTREALMLAALCDRVDMLAYITIRAAGGKPKKPTPFPRPGVVDKSACAPDPRAVAFLDRLRRQRGHGT